MSKTGMTWDEFDGFMDKLHALSVLLEMPRRYEALKRNSELGKDCHYAALAAHLFVEKDLAGLAERICEVKEALEDVVLLSMGEASGPLVLMQAEDGIGEEAPQASSP